MGAYIIRRLLWIAVTMVGVSLLTFVLIFASGDPAEMLAPQRAGQEPDPAAVAAVRQAYGLDQPLPVQYGRYMGKLLTGDMGYSYYFRRPVRELLLQKFGATALLAGVIMVVAVLVGIPTGMLAALRRNSLLDRAITVYAALVLAVPSFLLALVLIYFLAFQLRWFPIGGYGSWRHMVLPVLSVALPTSMAYAIFLRTNMLSTVTADYVRTAQAKGLVDRVVALRHILPNALLPVVTLASIDLAYLLTGIVLVETVFQYPGIGLQVWQATQQKDIPVIMGSVFFGALLIGLGNLLADLLAARLDPRIRLGR